MQNAAKKTIQASVNQSNLLNHLKEMFSTKTTFLGELMQNTRRAGAPTVNIDIIEHGEEALDIIVTDLGCGIEDMSKLIAVADSGWDEATINAEEPFGMGFMSVVFVADHVMVESKGKAIRFTKDDILNKRQITIEGSDFIGGTRVTLSGVKQKTTSIRDAIRKNASGFAIDVVVDGMNLRSPNRLSTLPAVESDVGMIYIPYLHSPEYAKSRQHHNCYDRTSLLYTSLYCQGLPMGTSYSGSIVHLDHKRFKPRMPDREGLVNPKEAQVEIEAAITLCWREYLEAVLEKEGADVVAKHYWGIASILGFDDLLNKADIIPACAVREQKSTPIKTTWDQEVDDECETDLHRDVVESGEHMLVLASSIPDEMEMVIRLWLRETKAYLVETLPKGHWGEKYITDLSMEIPEVVGETVKSAQFWGNECSGEIRIVKDLGIRLLGKTVPISSGFTARGDDDDSHSAVFYIPADGTRDVSNILRQASNYVDSDTDRVDEDVLAEDEVELNREIAILLGMDASGVFSSFLQETSIRSFKMLHGKSFTITFNETGEYEIKEISNV